MLEKVLNAIERFSLINKGDTVTVALSGGADSVALLHALWKLRDKLSITVKAAHLNHGIRGNEADRDEAFVKWFCLKFDIPIVCETVDIPSLAKEKGQSLELCAREVRYEFLSRNADGLIATAHTASDNTETLLFNLTRGSGTKGLSGIPPKRDNFIRPLIFCSRYDIEKYCIDNSLSYVTDSTNLTDDYTRNKIRHNVVTTLKEINPSLEDAIVRATDILREDNEALEFFTNEALFKSVSDDGLLCESIINLPMAVAKRVIIKYTETVESELQLDYLHVNALYDICKNGGKISLPCGFYGEVKNGVLVIFCDEIVKNTEFYAELIKVEKINNLLSINLIDCDKIIGKPIIRTRKERDSIRLKNRGCTKTLNKLFTENKVDIAIRDSIPVIADDEGVIWVYGMGVSQRCAPNSNSKNVMEVRAGVIE
ncbi:MAG: tRNA lysidine(34) synthetase TilS [Clostridia bacterium]|nr:tRNA lysidine(34) synthetase TilS [Clostridia bacterium]